MADELFEIIIHGRAGQGAKSMAQVIAEAAMGKGKHMQTFPSYGAEKTGAPMLAYVRISSTPIKTHAPVTRADSVIIIDPTLVETVNVKNNLKEKGIVLVNSPKSAEEIKSRLGCSHKVYALDATGIASKILGSNHPNMPMLGAFVKTAGVVSMHDVLGHLVCIFEHKMSREMLEKNIEAVKEGYEAMELPFQAVPSQTREALK